MALSASLGATSRVTRHWALAWVTTLWSPDAYRSPHRRSWERPPLLQSAPPLLGFFSSAHRSCSPHRRSWDFAPAPTAPAVRTAAPAVHGRRTPTVMKPGSAARETGRTLPKTTTITTTPSSSAASDCEDTPSPHGPLCHLHHRRLRVSGGANICWILVVEDI
ncbi:uncharacterized protein HKW66_Vig0001560 [Vigna angularis]|uniref:Uncharacterized protein n=1 Tax=Phaseolus angularis TaxID=3914 RepID=A0A8T0LDA9_PHAAN|nr:uncharacterized protein HKW66_Vig0001560 [Vigna angularis]